MECDWEVMSLQWPTEIMQFYFVVTCHIAMMLLNICPICANVIILFSCGKYMSAPFETLLNLAFVFCKEVNSELSR